MKGSEHYDHLGYGALPSGPLEESCADATLEFLPVHTCRTISLIEKMHREFMESLFCPPRLLGYKHDFVSFDECAKIETNALDEISKPKKVEPMVIRYAPPVARNKPYFVDN